MPDDYLIYQAVAYNTGLRPLDFHDSDLVDGLGAGDFQEHAVHKGIFGAIRAMTMAIQDDPGDNRSLREWSEALNVDFDELSRTFTTVTGDHFPRWRASLRVNAARKLLDRGENVGTAARKVGYSHATGLTKTFREVLGITPSGYIRQRRWLH
ncbi:helix-turn-helix domain-containing protein [Corynebacterium neomassiliense]|uniref:helix-turn-helix domain-containing protein n=1 Tax=Corynebacterium neomassiliense TaxID=2079482 RepID=UPI001F22B09A|nr:AraC family transcriptional regulator [Corynebacterium neomassiliense]